MISWNNLEAQEERYRDFLREADSDRLLRLATAGNPRRPLHARALSWLGIRMSNMGESLQRRYGSAVPAQAAGPNGEKAVPGRLVMLVPATTYGFAMGGRASRVLPLSAPCDENRQVAA